MNAYIAFPLLQDYFIANYTPSWIESPGLSSDAIWGSPIFLPAAEILQNNATALDGVFNLNATLLNFLNDGKNPSFVSFHETSQGDICLCQALALPPEPSPKC